MPRDAVIENPVINSPIREPDRHFRFDEGGITSDVLEGRRVSSYFVSIPSARKRGRPRAFETQWTSDRLEENQTINRIWERVSPWRLGGHQRVTSATRRLLMKHRPDTERQRPFAFFPIGGRRAVPQTTPGHTPAQPSPREHRRSDRLRRVRATRDGGR